MKPITFSSLQNGLSSTSYKEGSWLGYTPRALVLSPHDEHITMYTPSSCFNGSHPYDEFWADAKFLSSAWSIPPSLAGLSFIREYVSDFTIEEWEAPSNCCYPSKSCTCIPF